MKKQLLLFAMLLLPMIADAETVEIDGIYYNLIEKAKIAEVRPHPSNDWEIYSGDITIPSTVNHDGIEYKVTTIGNSAFCRRRITSISLPEGLTKIDVMAFFDCQSLNSIIIPQTLTHIGSNAFYCSIGQRSTSVYISNLTAWLSISCNYESNPLYGGGRLYLNGEEIIDLEIPNGVNSIGAGTFYDCQSIKTVKIPSSVIAIGNDAFGNCKYLEPVNISNGMKTIGHGAFKNCENLNSIVLPNTITSIGENAFRACHGINVINLPSSLTNIGSGAFQYCLNLSSITIPNGVDSIRGGNQFGVFDNCTNLSTVTLGKGVKVIERGAFNSCKKLTDVYCLAEEVPHADKNAFIDSYIEYTTLHVPASSISAYKAVEPWNNFMSIVALEGSDMPEQQKCATPTIAYINGKLVFDCETEDVDFISEIKTIDQKKLYDKEVSLTPPTTTITVYATKTGFDNSDVVTATIGWRNGTPILEGFSSIKLDGTETNGDVNGDGIVDVADISAIISLMAGK